MVRQFLGIAAAAVLVAGAARGAAAQHMTGTGRIVTLPKPVALDTTGHFQAAAARVGDDIIITGQPSAQALRELRAQGVTTVVNLRMPEEMARVNFDEAATVAQLGMTYVTLPMRGTAEAPYAPAAVTKFADVMAHANGKVLLHCTVAWRASHLWAAYLIRERGVPVDEALANARAINLMDTHRMGDNGRQPVEDFLDRTLPTLGHPPAPPPSGAAAASAPAPAPAPATINGGLPAVSPDGKWIAFTRQGPGVTAGLYVIGVDGSNERRLADVPDGRLHWTADAKAVYFGVGKFTDDSSDIRRVSVTGGAPTLIERVRARDGEMTPDGTEFWGVSGKFPDLTLVHIPLGSHQVHHVMREPGPVMNPAIGRDGRIAVARVDSTRDMQVWLFDNGTLHQLTHFAANDGRPQWPSWSPDGTVLAVQAGVYDRNHPESNTAHIWLVDAATGTARKLAAHDAPYLDETPSFFPDGRRIAFQSNRTGRMEVWVMNVDGSGARQITR